MKNIYASDKKSILFFRRIMIKQLLKRCILELKRLWVLQFVGLSVKGVAL